MIIWLPLVCFTSLLCKIVSLTYPDEAWFPANTQPNGNLHVFQPFIDDNFKEKLCSAVLRADNLRPKDKSICSRFQWVTVTGFRESSAPNAGTWVVMGGMVMRPLNSTDDSPFATEVVGVVGCELFPKKTTPAGFHLTECYPLEVNRVGNFGLERAADGKGRSGLLGIGLASLQLTAPADGAVLVFCDPLWHADHLHPGGLCRIRFRREGMWVKINHTGEIFDESIQFCTSSGHSQPCGGGFSIDLIQTASATNRTAAVPNVKLVVGLPYAQPFGRVQQVDDILRNFAVSNSPISNWITVHRVLGTEMNFGTKVTWTPTATEATVGAERHQTGQTQDYLTRENLILVASPTGSPQSHVIAFRQRRTHFGEEAFRIEMEINGTSLNTGFGQAMDTVHLPVAAETGQADYAVLIGAPFDSHTRKGPNVGRVYIVCPGPNSTEVSASLEGPYGQAFFGYSIARVGDVDGDGIEDVAIGAPGLQYSFDMEKSQVPVVGRVYIHRVTAQCTFDPSPIQVLQAPDSEPGDGFGVGLARSVDVDADGAPELLITSLRPGVPPYIFTMPLRLKAQCQFSLSPIYTLAPFQAGTTIPVSILVRIFNPRTNEWLRIPEGLLSSTNRLHQINPDIVWQERYWGDANNTVVEDPAEVFFTSQRDGRMDSSKPRFQLLPGSLQLVPGQQDGKQMRVKFALQALYGVQMMDFVDVPHKVAYRSLPVVDGCAANYVHSCSKAQQPLLDWSQCEAELKLVKHVCIPAPECESDLELTRDDNASTSTSPLLLEWGRPREQHQILRVKLTNRGPTKATGVRLQIKITGRLPGSPQMGLNAYITNIEVLQPENSAKLSDNILLRRTRRWIVNTAQDDVAALITARSHNWMYPNESIVIILSLFVGLTEGAESQHTELVGTLMKLASKGDQSFHPGVLIKVLSATNDLFPENDQLFTPFRLVYRPQIEISAGQQPSNLIDNRKESTLMDQRNLLHRVLSSDIGPKVEHVFLIENRGEMDLSNLVFMLDLPIATNDNQPLVYLVDRVRQLQTQGSDDSRRWKYSETSQKLTRQKRRGNVDIVISRVDRIDDSQLSPLAEPGSSEPVSGTSFKRATRGRIQLRCPVHLPSDGENDPIRGSPDIDHIRRIQCLSVRCELQRLDKFDTVRLHWSGWLWAGSFFQLHTPDVQLSSQLRLEHWGDTPPIITAYNTIQTEYPDTPKIVDFVYPKNIPSFEMKQSIFFRGVQPELGHKVPLWPIIVGVVIGSLLLIFLGTCCYCCGFFRRQRMEQRMKQEQRQSHFKDPSHVPLIVGEQRNLERKLVPPFLTAKSPQSLEARRKRKVANGHPSAKPRGLQQPLNEPEFMVQESPDLLCAEEPEPPSPQLKHASKGWEANCKAKATSVHETKITENTQQHKSSIEPSDKDEPCDSSPLRTTQSPTSLSDLPASSISAPNSHFLSNENINKPWDSTVASEISSSVSMNNGELRESQVSDIVETEDCSK
ncbi:uncharacterized protein DEA37_0012409 [Paragonimus westermani]|uniref:Integrin alpha third immunoglobulin-like domain-containing protein n=1 Tax=Paragonimus westermani TaxID=34504 RepID=A0A5J4NNP1_9TREM|nr:uncharacterized protein DEA37_0012409 [Paragonimus westermani]